MLRTQVYLTQEQRRELDRTARREGLTLAELIRRAIDSYLKRPPGKQDDEALLDELFGSLPELEVPPRTEWNRGR